MPGLDAINQKLKAMQDFKKQAPKIAVDGLMEEEALVLDMVYQEQLYEEGINGRNVPIADYQPYSPTTIWIKQQKGQPVDRVTLRDTGDFHSSGELNRLNDLEAEIDSDDWKTEDLKERYGEEILWLKPDNMKEIQHVYIKPYMKEQLKKRL